MAHLRFTTARELFEAFPTARDDIGAEPTDEGPWAFLKTLLASPTPEDAIAFCAYLLPRREAVWWACQCVRVLAPPRDEAEQAALDTAETWVREPEESRRRVALQLGMTSERQSPATWLLLAAGWSGGSMVEGEHPVPAPSHLTAKAARAAILIALARKGVGERATQLRACIEGGVQLAGGDVLQLR